MCSCSRRVPLRRGCLFRFGLRLSPSVSSSMTTGAVLTALIYDNEERSGVPLRTVTGGAWTFDSANARYFCTMAAASVDANPPLEQGSIYYVAVNAIWGTETDAQRIAEFEVDS